MPLAAWLGWKAVLLGARACDDGTFALEWAVPAHDGGAPIIAYDVYAAADAAADAEWRAVPHEPAPMGGTAAQRVRALVRALRPGLTYVAHTALPPASTALWSTKSTRRCALVPSSAVAHAAARRPVRVRLAHCGPGRAAADPPALRCTATASACARAICTAAAPSPPSSHSRALLHARHLRRACMPSCVRWEALGACGLDGTSRTTAARLWRRTR